MYIRTLHEQIIRLTDNWSVISVTGPRQSGKTTLCKMAFPNYHYVNLEDVVRREQIRQDISSFLLQHDDGLILDEAQYLPELFSALQVVVDERRSARYILSGSSDFLLMRSISESLAGRVAIVRLLPLSMSELGKDAMIPINELMYRGFYPGVWGDGKDPYLVYDSYISTYIERDIRLITAVKDLSLFQRFLRLMAARVGTEFNASSLSSDLGIDAKTVSSWLSILETSYTAFRLNPFFRNIGKRLSKASKIYFYDTGLVCFLLGIETPQQLDTHPLRGAIFENMVVVEMIKSRYNRMRRSNLYFYRDKTHEVDLIAEESNGVRAYEIKSANRFNPEFTSQLNYLRTVLHDEFLESTVIYSGTEELTTHKFTLKSVYSLAEST